MASWYFPGRYVWVNSSSVPYSSVFICVNCIRIVLGRMSNLWSGKHEIVSCAPADVAVLLVALSYEHSLLETWKCLFDAFF